MLQITYFYLQKYENMLQYRCIHRSECDSMENTKVYDSKEFQNEYVSEVVKEVALILEERGYNPVNQIVGYLMSGDPGYISSHKEARNKITKFDRIEILEVILDKFLKCDI